MPEPDEPNIVRVVMPRTDKGNDPADHDPVADSGFFEETERRIDQAVNELPSLAERRVAQALLQQPTEDNVALAFALMHSGQYVYLHGRGRWFKWSGTHWEDDVCCSVRDEIRNLARDINRDGTVTPAKASFVSGVELLLRSDPVFARSVEDFDADTDLMNTPAGTYNLRTGEKQAHNPEDKITRCTKVGPSPKGGTRFLQFMEEITASDASLIDFHQQSLGACLSGAIEGHWLLFWYGSTARNGKNTLGDTILHILGSYAGTMPTSALMQKQNEAHPTEMMNLRGKRLVVSSEVPEGSHWNEARLKETTGDTMLQGHYMRQDWVSFKRTHKHLIYGNYRPALRNIEPAIQARFKLVPFPVSFLGREDPDLPQKLMAEADFILHWLTQGHAKWRRAGKRLPECPAVDHASKEYFRTQSTYEAWVDENCERIDLDERAGYHLPKASELYKNYAEWKRNRGESPVSQTRWGEWMHVHFERVKSDGFRYRGLKIGPTAGV